MALDSIIVLFSIYIGYFILHPYMDVYSIPMLMMSSISLLLSHHLFALIYSLYKRAWEYASINEMLAIIKAITFSILTTAVVQLVVAQHIYVRVLFITWMFHIIFIGGSRFSWRMLRDRYINKSHDRKRTLIVGAGAAGTMVARQLLKSKDSEFRPIAFADDDIKKQKLQIYGITVKGKIKEIPLIVQKYEIDNIIIAIPSLKGKEIKRIYEQCAKTEAKTKILPMIEDVMTGKISVSQFRDVQVEDLLGREPVELDIRNISQKLTGSTVLVTGAGGSIGSISLKYYKVKYPLLRVYTMVVIVSIYATLSIFINSFWGNILLGSISLTVLFILFYKDSLYIIKNRKVLLD